MPTAIEVAEWIVHYRHDDLAVPVDPMSLEKLTYYAQCFYLALNERRLFDDEIRAWRHGPVIRSVYDQYKGFGASPIIPTDVGDSLEPVLEVFLSDLVGFFGHYTAIHLSNATHAEEPWIKARRGFSRQANSDVLMPTDDLQSYYCTLISEGEEALSRHELLDVVPEPRWAWLYLAGISARLMLRHPFYRPALAKALAEPVPKLDDLPDEFFSPIGKPDFIDVESGKTQ